jgi:hypothetical protein
MGLEAAHATASLIVASGEHYDWAVAIEPVRDILLETDWRGSPPIDIAALWGSALDQRETKGRLIVVETRVGVCALRAPRLVYQTVPRSSILPLPPLLRGRWARRGIAGIVFQASVRPTFVLDPDGLTEILPQEMRSSVSPGDIDG